MTPGESPKGKSEVMDIALHKKFLIVGASGDLGFCVLEMLSRYPVWIGAHSHRNKARFEKFLQRKTPAKLKIFNGDISSQKNSAKLVRSFIQWAGGIDGLMQLSGSVKEPKNWDTLDQDSWDRDIAVNLSGPFFLAQEAMKHMRRKGGRIILTSTASVVHGGGRNSMAYGAAKAGIECITKGLAREGAKHNILVNAIAPGFIKTQFHLKQMKRTQKDIMARANLVPLKRAGQPEDVANMVIYLLSPMSNYLTGLVIPISGGDWL